MTASRIGLRDVPYRGIAVPVITTLLVKIGLYFLYISGDPLREFVNHIFIDNPDRAEYLVPIDNLFEYGTYSLNPHGEPYAGRLPGFVFPYMLFRAIFSEHVSNWLLGLFIFGISLLATIRLAKLVQATTGNRLAVIFALISIEALPYYWYWDWVLHPNSLGVSCIILGITFFYDYLLTGKFLQLIACGFFVSWLFLLRGFTLIFVPIFVLVIVLHVHSHYRSIVRILAQVSIFILPLFVFETVWIVRNYYSLGKIVPLQTSFVPGAKNGNSEYGFQSNTKHSLMSLRTLIDCWGGDNFWYFYKSDMSWFTSPHEKATAKEHFSTKIFTEKITPDTLEELRTDVLRSFSKDITPLEHDSVEALIVAKSERYRSTFIAEKPLYFAFVAPIHRLGNLFLKSPVQDWPGTVSRLYWLKLLIKGISAAIFFGNVLFFLFLLATRFGAIGKYQVALLLALLVLGLTLMFAYVLNVAHFSYFIFGYVPMVLFNTVVGINWPFDRPRIIRKPAVKVSLET